eukprot:20314-Heterococcus_DN1.PRE.6
MRRLQPAAAAAQARSSGPMHVVRTPILSIIEHFTNNYTIVHTTSHVPRIANRAATDLQHNDTANKWQLGCTGHNGASAALTQCSIAQQYTAAAIMNTQLLYLIAATHGAHTSAMQCSTATLH